MRSERRGWKKKKKINNCHRCLLRPTGCRRGHRRGYCIIFSIVPNSLQSHWPRDDAAVVGGLVCVVSFRGVQCSEVRYLVRTRFTVHRHAVFNDVNRNIMQPAQERFSCNICEKTYSRKDTLVKHIKTVHESKFHFSIKHFVLKVHFSLSIATAPNQCPKGSIEISPGLYALDLPACTSSNYNIFIKYTHGNKTMTVSFSVIETIQTIVYRKRSK